MTFAPPTGDPVDPKMVYTVEQLSRMVDLASTVVIDHRQTIITMSQAILELVKRISLIERVIMSQGPSAIAMPAAPTGPVVEEVHGVYL